MAVHSDFKGLRGSILHRSPFSFIDIVANELLAEEIRLQSYPEWILDSSAPYHISPDSSSFAYVSPSSSIPVMTIDGTSMPLADVGSIVVPHLSLPNVYLILKLTLNLTYVGQLCDSGNYLVIFSFSFCCVQDLQSQKLIQTGRRKEGLYILNELKMSVVVVPHLSLRNVYLILKLTLNLTYVG
jgi:hypothetical protein